MTSISELLAPKRRVTIVTEGDPVQAIQLDASINETHKRTAETTDHPVEVGGDTTDHIRFRPKELDVTGIVTNTPIQLLATQRASGSVLGGDPRSRAEDAFKALEKIMENGTLVTIATKFASYESMALTSLTVPRDAARGNVAELQMTFREIRLASTKRVAETRPTDPSRGVRERLGKQGTTTAPEPVRVSAAASTLGLGP